MAADINERICGWCICCLAEGAQRGGGYIEIFKKYLNLIIVPKSGMSIHMCSACIRFVEEVEKFRETVLASQRHLAGVIIVTENNTDIINAGGGSKNNPVSIQKVKVKEEVCEEDNLESTFLWPDNSADIIDNHMDVSENDEASSKIKLEDVNIKNETEAMKNTKQERKLSIKNSNIKLKNIRMNSDSESDTLISEIEKNNSHLQVEKKSKPTLSSSELLQLRSVIKENKKIRLNIILLLKYSTILPFLNNFKSPYKCFYCDETYIRFTELKEHTEKEHTDICENKVKKVLRKLPEYIVTADISCLKCKICAEQFKCIENLIEHLCGAHNKIYHETDKVPSHGFIVFDLSNDVLKCHICHKDFPFFKNLLVHMNEHGSFICYICGNKFFSERKYRSHLNKHEKTEATCKKCGKTFVSISAMGHHNRKEHVKSKIKCLKCPETFHFEHYAKRLEHMEKVHGIKKPQFKCDTCGKVCTSSGTLSTHINLMHKRSKEYCCDICTYATFNSSHFKNHMNTHTGVKNHECHICKKRFLKMYSLTRHMMMHMNDKRFACPLCEATFIQKANMKSHIRHRHKDFDLSKL